MGEAPLVARSILLTPESCLAVQAVVTCRLEVTHEDSISYRSLFCNRCGSR